ncbi:MAG TPA: aminotransferase class V-fold PLP-dependent enzyme [Acidobacteriota bacterium]|jgi:selenocysteine lyase/cysteine desulfurase
MEYWEKARAETPGCKNVLHFNNAGAALMPETVVNAVTDHIRLESEIGGYEAAEKKRKETERLYHAAAVMLNCNADEIAFIENATRAWDMAFYSIPFRSGDRILTAASEYASNFISYLQLARKIGVVIDVIPSDKSGEVSVDALANMMDQRVKLIAITHVPTNGGLVNPAAAVGKIAREANVLYLLDACQSAGQMPLDVKQIGCSMLSATGRKFIRGPRATGFLYIDHRIAEMLEPVFLDMHAATWKAMERYEIRHDARRFENWEQNYAGKIGLATAIDYAMQWGIDRTYKRIQHLAGMLRERLSKTSKTTVRDLGKEKCGIVTFSIDGTEPDKIKAELASRNINVTVSRKSSTLIDMQSRGLENLVRASLHYYNTEEEVDRFCKTLSEIL